MADTLQLKTEQRTGKGSRDAARLRKAGRVPAIVYGHKETPAAVSVSHEELESALRHHARTLDLLIDGKTETVLIQEVQHDHLGTGLVHVDFRRVSKDERVRTIVEIELRGTAPGATGGGVLDQPLHQIHVECPAMAIPESIRVRIDSLLLGQAIHVKELDLPDGVKALDDPDLVVVQVKLPHVAAPVAPVLPAEGTAEPEVITKKKEKPAEEE